MFEDGVLHHVVQQLGSERDNFGTQYERAGGNIHLERFRGYDKVRVNGTDVRNLGVYPIKWVPGN